MSLTTVQLDSDVIAFIHKHGRFPETLSDVLRRCLIGFGDNGSSGVNDDSSESPIVPISQGRRKPQPRLFGHSRVSIIRWMRNDGWSHADVRRVFDSYELEIDDKTIDCQLWAGREGAVADLTKEQVKELRERTQR